MLSVVALLHTAARIDWLRWTVHPSTVIGMLRPGALYFWRLRVAQRAGGRLPRGPAARVRGWARGAVRFAQRPDSRPERLVSVQRAHGAAPPAHLLVPPLLIIGTSAVDASLGPRAASGGAVATRITTGAALLRHLQRRTLVAWHLPPLYNLAMADHRVHIRPAPVLHGRRGADVVAALERVPELPRAVASGPDALHLSAHDIPMSIVAHDIAYGRQVLYPAYASAPRMWGLSPQEDQLDRGADHVDPRFAPLHRDPDGGILSVGERG